MDIIPNILGAIFHFLNDCAHLRFFVSNNQNDKCSFFDDIPAVIVADKLAQDLIDYQNSPEYLANKAYDQNLADKAYKKWLGTKWDEYPEYA